jgi:hypothetical protein
MEEEIGLVARVRGAIKKRRRAGGRGVVGVVRCDGGGPEGLTPFS